MQVKIEKDTPKNQSQSMPCRDNQKNLSLFDSSALCRPNKVVFLFGFHDMMFDFSNGQPNIEHLYNTGE